MLVSTDVWVSMGDEKQAARRQAAFLDYQVNEDPYSIRQNQMQYSCIVFLL